MQWGAFSSADFIANVACTDLNGTPADAQFGRFPIVPGDDEEFIPIPEFPNTVSYP